MINCITTDSLKHGVFTRLVKDLLPDLLSKGFLFTPIDKKPEDKSNDEFSVFDSEDVHGEVLVNFIFSRRRISQDLTKMVLDWFHENSIDYELSHHYE